MKVADKLKQIFPTPDSVLEVKKNYTTWLQMANAVGVSINSLFDHRKVLGMEMAKGNASKGGRQTVHLTDDEIRENIREMVESRNVYVKYRITDMDEFMKNPCGNDGIELVGMEKGIVWNHEHNPGVRR